MGGTVGLTVRFGPGDEYRGSCWTNVLTRGLWAAAFYDPATSLTHTRAWIDDLKARRAAEPEIEAMWGGWNKFAPIGYGIVAIDYVTSTMVNLQGYSSPHRVFDWGEADPASTEKWKELEAKSLLYDVEDRPRGVRLAKIKLPFTTTILGHEGEIRKAYPWARANFDLTREERVAWVRCIRRWDADA